MFILLFQNRFFVFLSVVSKLSAVVLEQKRDEMLQAGTLIIESPSSSSSSAGVSSGSLIGRIRSASQSAFFYVLVYFWS
jgi:hypothetical protein